MMDITITITIVKYVLIGIVLFVCLKYLNPCKLNGTKYLLMICIPLITIIGLDLLIYILYMTLNENFEGNIDNSEENINESVEIVPTETVPDGNPDGNPGIEQLQTQVPPHNFKASETGICKKINGTCTYNTLATEQQKSKYLCHNNPLGECIPFVPCKKSGDSCDLNASAKTNQDLNSRTCVLQQIPAHGVCRLTDLSENFKGIESFEGFSSI